MENKNTSLTAAFATVKKKYPNSQVIQVQRLMSAKLQGKKGGVLLAI